MPNAVPRSQPGTHGALESAGRSATTGRKPWARTSFDLADDLGIPASIFVEAALLCNCWWVKGSKSMIGRNDAERVTDWLEHLGVISVLQSEGHQQRATEPQAMAPVGPISTVHTAAPSGPIDERLVDGTPAGEPHVGELHADGPAIDEVPDDTAAIEELPTPLTATRLADIARIETLVREHLGLLGERYGRWLIGEVLRLLWDNTPARRVLKERGILLADLRTGIEGAIGPPSMLPSDSAFTGTVFNELKRLHRARLAFLFIEDAQTDHPRLVTNDRPSATTNRWRRASSDDDPGEFQVGQVVWVAVEENDRGMRSKKRHPAVLLARTGRRNDRWLIVTMTTEVTDDPDRRRVPDGERMGLDYGGYVWHIALKVYKTQIERAVGWIHHELIGVLDHVLDLRQSIIDDLRNVADRHHRPAE